MNGLITVRWSYFSQWKPLGIINLKLWKNVHPLERKIICAHYLNASILINISFPDTDCASSPAAFWKAPRGSLCALYLNIYGHKNYQFSPSYTLSSCLFLPVLVVQLITCFLWFSVLCQGQSASGPHFWEKFQILFLFHLALHNTRKESSFIAFALFLM